MSLYSNDDIMTVFKNNNFTKENPVSITTLMKYFNMSRWSVNDRITKLFEKGMLDRKKSGLSYLYYIAEKSGTKDDTDTRPEKKGCNVEGYKDPTAEAAMKTMTSPVYKLDVMNGSVYEIIHNGFKNRVLVLAHNGSVATIVYVWDSNSGMINPYKIYVKSDVSYYIDICKLAYIKSSDLKDRVTAINISTFGDILEKLAIYLQISQNNSSATEELAINNLRKNLKRSADKYNALAKRFDFVTKDSQTIYAENKKLKEELEILKKNTGNTSTIHQFGETILQQDKDLEVVRLRAQIEILKNILIERG